MNKQRESNRYFRKCKVQFFKILNLICFALVLNCCSNSSNNNSNNVSLSQLNSAIIGKWENKFESYGRRYQTILTFKETGEGALEERLVVPNGSTLKTNFPFLKYSFTTSESSNTMIVEYGEISGVFSGDHLEDQLNDYKYEYSYKLVKYSIDYENTNAILIDGKRYIRLK